MGRLNKRGSWAWVACLSIVGSVQAEILDDSTPVTPTEAAPAPAAISEGSITQTIEDGSYASTCTTCMQTPKAGFLRSDHAFDDMIMPISNPIFAIDPRSSTHARILFVNNWTPGTHLVAPDDSFQVYAGQINLALTERLSFIAQKDGYAVVNRGPLGDGLLNVAAGLKYAFIRKPEDQLIVSAGLMYEIPSGEAAVFQGHGSGILTPFISAGKGWGRFHSVSNLGYAIGLDDQENTSFIYMQQHFNYQLTNWFYPVAELNWFHYTNGADRGLPAALGEGDGLINFGTTDMAGADLVTAAFGARIQPYFWFSLGAAYEFPISSREDLIEHRLIVDMIFRY